MYPSKLLIGLFMLQSSVPKTPPAIPLDLLLQAERSAKHMLAVQQEREQILQKIQDFCSKNNSTLTSKGEDLVCEVKPEAPKGEKK